VKRFCASQQFLSDDFVLSIARTHERSRDRKGLLGIIGRLADAPFVTFPHVPGNHVAGMAMESGDAFRIPHSNRSGAQRLGLFADRVASRNSLETADDAFLK
jgi:hypothetical protein